MVAGCSVLAHAANNSGIAQTKAKVLNSEFTEDASITKFWF